MTLNKSTDKCPCGSQHQYSQCCGHYIENKCIYILDTDTSDADNLRTSNPKTNHLQTSDLKTNDLKESDLRIANVELEPAKSPSTAEMLMRSRYTAYTQGNIAYLLYTTHRDSRNLQSPQEIQIGLQTTDWQKLEIIHKKKGEQSDNIGFVEFKAYYIENGQLKIHHEISMFIKQDGQWLFLNTPPPSKNSPCPCESGKKYKRCCG